MKLNQLGFLGVWLSIHTISGELGGIIHPIGQIARVRGSSRYTPNQATSRPSTDVPGTKRPSITGRVGTIRKHGSGCSGGSKGTAKSTMISGSKGTAKSTMVSETGDSAKSTKSTTAGSGSSKGSMESGTSSTESGTGSSKGMMSGSCSEESRAPTTPAPTPQPTPQGPTSPPTPCQDDPSWTYFLNGDPTRPFTCSQGAWLTVNNFARCTSESIVDENGRTAGEACRTTCQTCP